MTLTEMCTVEHTVLFQKNGLEVIIPISVFEFKKSARFTLILSSRHFNHNIILIQSPRLVLGSYNGCLTAEQQTGI